MATFFIVVVLPGQYSGERLQDHWSSGFENFFNQTKCSPLNAKMCVCIYSDDIHVHAFLNMATAKYGIFCI